MFKCFICQAVHFPCQSFVVDTVICFLVNKLVVDHLNEHFSFKSYEKDVVKADCLVIYKPFDIQSAYGEDESQYIVPLFSL